MKLAIEDTFDTLPAAYGCPLYAQSVQRCLRMCTRVTPNETQASMLKEGAVTVTWALHPTQCSEPIKIISRSY